MKKIKQGKEERRDKAEQNNVEDRRRRRQERDKSSQGTASIVQYDVTKTKN